MPQGDAEDLPFPTDRFDRYVSAGSIEYWPEPQRGIKEAYRVVKEGGLACVIGPVHPTLWLSRFFADVWMLFPTEDEYIEVAASSTSVLQPTFLCRLKGFLIWTCLRGNIYITVFIVLHSYSFLKPLSIDQ